MKNPPKKRVSELVNVKINQRNSRIKQLKNTIQKEEYFKNKEWLLEKINQEEQTTEALKASVV